MNSANYKEMMAELRDEYLASFPEKFDLMRGFFEGRDWYSLELEFHKLKGTGSTYGAPEVTELCELLETLCRTKGQLDEPSLELAIGLLTDIRKKYLENFNFDLTQDTRFDELKKK